MMPDFDDDKGVSLVFISTSKGQDYFNKLPMEVRDFDYTSIVNANGGFNEHTHSHPKRKLFFVAYSLNQSVSETVNKLLYVSVYHRFVIWSNQAFRKVLRIVLPSSVVKSLKRLCGCLLYTSPSPRDRG